MTEQQDFAQANRAFELFTLAERKQALEEFARLQFPSIVDRFYEAVYRVIHEKDKQVWQREKAQS